MATVKQRESGYWQAKIRRKGYPTQSKTFKLKVDAEAWARTVESEMDRSVFVSRAEAEQTTFAEAADRYAREILPSKRGADRDRYRIHFVKEVFGKYALASITSSQIAAFRDNRLADGMAPQSVVHDLNMISRIFKAATLDWGIAIPTGIPTAGVRKPSLSNRRDRRLLLGEEELLLAAIHSSRSHSNWLAPIVLFALETAARQSEILSLDWRDVDLRTRVVKLRGIGGRETKNNDKFRPVPLSSAAVAMLSELPRSIKGQVFPVTQEAVKQSWSRTVKRARFMYERDSLIAALVAEGRDQKEAEREVRQVRRLGGPAPRNLRISTPLKRALAALEDDPMLLDLHFHDLRHEATSRLAEKLQVHELAKVTGHKDTKMLLSYYHPRAEDLAKKIG